MKKKVCWYLASQIFRNLVPLRQEPCGIKSFSSITFVASMSWNIHVARIQRTGNCGFCWFIAVTTGSAQRSAWRERETERSWQLGNKDVISLTLSMEPGSQIWFPMPVITRNCVFGDSMEVEIRLEGLFEAPQASISSRLVPMEQLNCGWEIESNFVTSPTSPAGQPETR